MIIPETKFHPVYNSEGDTLKTIKCKVTSIYDGDTITACFPLFGEHEDIPVLMNCRLYGVDTPEMKGGDRKKEAAEAREFTQTFLKNNTDEDGYVSIEFQRKYDKYGRLLVRVFGKDGNTLNDELVNKGHAVSYFGGAKNTE